MVRIGAHDREGDPLAVVHATRADIVQFFLGDPQGDRKSTRLNSSH